MTDLRRFPRVPLGQPIEFSTKGEDLAVRIDGTGRDVSLGGKGCGAALAPSVQSGAYAHSCLESGVEERRLTPVYDPSARRLDPCSDLQRGPKRRVSRGVISLRILRKLARERLELEDGAAPLLHGLDARTPSGEKVRPQPEAELSGARLLSAEKLIHRPDFASSSGRGSSSPSKPAWRRCLSGGRCGGRACSLRRDGVCKSPRRAASARRGALASGIALPYLEATPRGRRWSPP
jgi:hypothetical protein